MRGRKPDEFSLKPKDKTSLRKLLHDGRTPLKVARRAQILLGRTDPKQPFPPACARGLKGWPARNQNRLAGM